MFCEPKICIEWPLIEKNENWKEIEVDMRLLNLFSKNSEYTVTVIQMGRENPL